MALLAIYQNNGCRIDDDGVRCKSVGDVIIQYDGRSYAGSFRSFQINETDEAPFIAEYSSTFMVRREWR